MTCRRFSLFEAQTRVSRHPGPAAPRRNPFPQVRGRMAASTWQLSRRSAAASGCCLARIASFSAGLPLGDVFESVHLPDPCDGAASGAA